MVALKKPKQTRKTGTAPAHAVSRAAWLVCGLGVDLSPGLWYRGCTPKATGAVGSLITVTAGQAGNSRAQCQAAPNLRGAKGPSEPALPPPSPLSLVTLRALICRSTCAMSFHPLDGKCGRAVNKRGGSRGWGMTPAGKTYREKGPFGHRVWCKDRLGG